MRPIALNRKNALFAGGDEGAEVWACLASLIETCRLNGVDPESLPRRWFSRSSSMAGRHLRSMSSCPGGQHDKARPR